MGRRKKGAPIPEGYVSPSEFDREMIRSKAAGELSPAAFEMMVKIAKKLSTTKLRYKDPMDRDDAVQEACLILLMRWHNFDAEKGKPFSYFTQIIKNAMAKSFNDNHPIKESNRVSVTGYDDGGMWTL